MNPLHKRLAGLRQRLRLVVTFRGSCWLLSVILLAAALAGLLDWHAHLPSLVRALLLVGTLSAAGHVAIRTLFRPLAERSDDLALALRVEALYPALNDSLGSTVQFLEQASRSEKHHDSSSLRLAAVQRTLRLIERCDFSPVVDTRGVGASGCALIATGALAVFLVIMNPALAWTALERLALPFGAAAWPRQTRIELEPETRVARGAAYNIDGLVRGTIPESAVIVYEGITPSRQVVTLRRERGSDLAKLAARLDRVERPFRFQVFANDAETEWYRVEVQPPPVLVPLNGRPSPQIRLRFPAYTDQPDQDLSDGTGNIEAVVGTRVTLRAAADRPLARAWLEYRPDLPMLTQAVAAGLVGMPRALPVITRLGAAEEYRRAIPARLDATGQVLQVDFTPCVRGMYALHIEDTSGLTNSRLFDLRLQTDPPPLVTLDRPSLSHDNVDVLAGAELTLQVAADDTPYAVSSLYLQYRCKKSGAMEPQEAQRMPLYDHQSAGDALGKTMWWMTVTPLKWPDARLRLRPARLLYQGRLALEQIKHDDGTDLREGDAVSLQGCAEDFDDISLAKAPGRSAEIELHIISRAALEAALNRDQTQVQEELLRLRKEQQDALERVIGAEQRWRNTGKLKPEDVDQLLQAEQVQQQIRARVGNQQEGLRAQVERVLRGMRDNRLPRSGIHDRMETVASELERLAREELEPIEPKLTNARKENETTRAGKPPRPEEKGPLSEAREHQEEVENTLDELLKLLEPWGNVSAVKGETKNILQDQRKLHGDVKKIDTLGKEREKLTADQKAALDKAAELQRKLEERTGQLLGKMKRLGDEIADKDAQAAAALKEAADKGREGTVKENMRSAGRNLRDNKIGEARDQQKDSIETLEDMVKALEERREQELDRLRRKLQEAQEKLDDINKRQEELRKKTQEAARNADPKKREQELKRLAEEQDKLQKEAQELARELRRLNYDKAADALNRAGEQMERSARRLEQGHEPQEPQQETLDRLNQAQRRLANEQERVEDELARERLAKVADQIKLFKERQESMIAEAERIQNEVLQKKGWDRADRFNLGKAAESQQSLAGEVDNLASDKLKDAQVFARVLTKSGQAMKQAAERMLAHRDKAGTTPKVGADNQIARLQQDALRRLEQLLDALKQDKGMARGGGGGGGGGGSGGGRSSNADGIPQIAQLKVLRALQVEVNERTDRFGKVHPDLGKLTPEEQKELLSIRKDQQEVADLLDELATPAEKEEK